MFKTLVNIQEEGIQENTTYCIDAFELLRKIPNESIDLVLTDPPYNTGMKKRSEKDHSNRLKNFFNDSYTDSEYQKLVAISSQEFWRVLKKDKSIYIYINWKEYPRWYYALKSVGFNIKDCIVWDKIQHGLGGQYKYAHEFIIFAVKGNPKIKPTNELGKYFTDIWRVQKLSSKAKQHDTQKVLPIVELPILHATGENDLVLDPFLGSGTTAIAAEKLKRKWIGGEILEQYCSIIEERLAKLRKQQSLF